MRRGAGRCNAVRYGMVRSSARGAVLRGAVHRSAVQYSTLQYGALRYGTVRWGTVRCGAAQYGMVRCNVVQCSKVRYGAVQCVCCVVVWCSILWSFRWEWSEKELSSVTLTLSWLNLVWYTISLSDTYVKVLHSVQGKVIERKKTKVVKKSTSPVFNEAFVFDVREEDLRRSSISCEVHRGDTVLKTERIGHITLDLESFGTEVRQWNDMITSPLKRVTETHLLHA